MRVEAMQTNLTSHSWKSAGSAKGTSSHSSAQELLDVLKTAALASNAGAMLGQSLATLAQQSNLSSKLSINMQTDQTPNLLSGYAGSSSSGQSRYVAATLSALKATAQMKNKMDDKLYDLVDQFGGVCVSGTYYPNPEAPSEAEIKAALQRQGTRAIVKNADEDFKEARDAAEQQAAQDAAPKDAMGNPIVIGVGAGSGTASTDPAASVPGSAADTAGPAAATGTDGTAPGATGDTAATDAAAASAGQAATQGVAAFQLAAGTGDSSQAAGSVDIVV